PSPQTGHYRQFRSYWLGRLLEPYLSGGTRFLIVRVPRNPWPIAHYARFDPHSSIRSLASRRHVVVADETLFQSLEKPAYFFDAFHLNRAGREAFTAGLAEFILRHFC
ncbi:MAG TPA: hypothetical protein VG672_08670, partial [Bryobacteraceae bacterium]|nr:hypothetical protein [Bryobacteraceae bacterium]